MELIFKNENKTEKFSVPENERLCIYSFNSQNNLTVELCGEGASFEYRSLCLSSVEQKIRVLHKAPSTKSFLFARHILNGDSKAIFNGIVEVGESAKNTNSRQLVNSILLSPDAKATSMPELKIYCDEVECSHGNTCGGLDEDSLFYLQSRGMSAAEAERILLQAFAEEVFPKTYGVFRRPLFY